jgi:hypothetical protein
LADIVVEPSRTLRHRFSVGYDNFCGWVVEFHRFLMICAGSEGWQNGFVEQSKNEASAASESFSKERGQGSELGRTNNKHRGTITKNGAVRTWVTLSAYVGSR